MAQDLAHYGRDRRDGVRLPELLEALRARDVDPVVPEPLPLLGGHHAAPARGDGARAADPAAISTCRSSTRPTRCSSACAARSASAPIREKVARFRDAVPDVAIRTTCIVGFPGETDGRLRAAARVPRGDAVRARRRVHVLAAGGDACRASGRRRARRRQARAARAADRTAARHHRRALRARAVGRTVRAIDRCGRPPAGRRQARAALAGRRHRRRDAGSTPTRRPARSSTSKSRTWWTTTISARALGGRARRAGGRAARQRSRTSARLHRELRAVTGAARARRAARRGAVGARRRSAGAAERVREDDQPTGDDPAEPPLPTDSAAQQPPQPEMPRDEAPPPRVEGARDVRVALATAAQGAVLSGTGAFRLFDARNAVLVRARDPDAWSVERRGRQLRAVRQGTATSWSDGLLTLRPDRDDEFVVFAGQRFRGVIRVVASDTGIVVVNVLAGGMVPARRGAARDRRPARGNEEGRGRGAGDRGAELHRRAARRDRRQLVAQCELRPALERGRPGVRRRRRGAAVLEPGRGAHAWGWSSSTAAAW